MTTRRALACLIALAVAAAPASLAADPVPRAREILRLYLDGKFDEFREAGTPDVKSALRPGLADQMSAQIAAQIGAFRKEIGETHSAQGGLTSVTFTLDHERGTLKLLVAVDAEGRMAGFFVAGLEPRTDGWKAPGYADANAFAEESVVVGKDPWALPGTLTLPKKAGPFPAVVLVHGSGPNDADETILANKPFKDLAWGLATRGIAVLRYEKRTKAHGAKMTGTVTLDEETIDDAVAAAALLRARKDVDPERVFVLGHSLGGTAAPFIAKKDGKLRGLVVLAGTPRPALDLVAEQMEHIARADGTVSEEEKKGLEDWKKSAADLRAGKKEALAANLLGAPGAYWLSFDTLDAAGAAKSLSLPMLFLQGGRDYQVTRACFETWQRALSGMKNVTFREFADSNHLFMAGEGVSTPDEYGKPGHVDGKVIDFVAEWIIASRG